MDVSSQGVCSSAQLEDLEAGLGAMQSSCAPSFSPTESPRIGGSLSTERSLPTTPEVSRPRKRMTGITPQTAARRSVTFASADCSDVASAEESALASRPGETTSAAVAAPADSWDVAEETSAAVAAPAPAASADKLTDTIVRMVGEDLKGSLSHLNPTEEMLRHARLINGKQSELHRLRSECETLDQTQEKQCLCAVTDVASTVKDFIQKDYPAEEDALEFYLRLEPILVDIVCNIYPIRACWCAKNSDDDFVCEHHNMKFMERNHLYACPTYTDSGRCWREEDSEKVLRAKLKEIYPDRSDECR